MNNNSKAPRGPRRGPGVPGEKAKDFKSAFKRLLKELKLFKVLIIIGITFAALGSILSIMAPNKLSSLTDIISEGLTVNEDVIKELSQRSIANVQNNNFADININGVTITFQEQAEYLNILSSVGENTDKTELLKLMETLPESVQEAITPKMDMDKVWSISLFLIVLYLCSAIFNYIEGFSMATVANKFANNLRARITHKINTLPLTYFDKHESGDILSRVTNDVDTLAQTMNQSLASLVGAVVLFIGTTLMMFVTNGTLAITAIVASTLGFVGMMLIMSKSQKYFAARQTELGDLNGYIEQIYSGLNIVKVSNGYKEIYEEFNKLNEKLNNSTKKSRFLSGAMHPMMGFIGNFGYVAVCIVGAMLTMNGKISFGVIVAFITYVRMFTSPLTEIAQAMTSMQSAAAASERVFEFLDEKQMPLENNISQKLSVEDVKGNIEFNDVVFTYEGNEKPTIKGFSAKASQGEKIAIVGPTGAGKTTLVNLLMKFYDLDSGSIIIDGVDTKELTRENLHNLFTMVLQDTWLFNGTVRENIIYNRENVPQEKVEEVCKNVGIDHFIRTLPKGYDTIIEDNDSISTGQKQLLTIARGMIEDAPFLILDEATSNVDTRTEELVQKAMDKLMEGRTSFIIAHRLSTIKNADLILVMNGGNIIEQGNHEELMEKGGFYAGIYNSQFEKFN